MVLACRGDPRGVYKTSTEVLASRKALLASQPVEVTEEMVDRFWEALNPPPSFEVQIAPNSADPRCIYKNSVRDLLRAALNRENQGE